MVSAKQRAKNTGTEPQIYYQKGNKLFIISYAENHQFYHRTQLKGWGNSRISNWEALEVEQPSKFKLCFSHTHVIDGTLSRLSLFCENDTYLPVSMHLKQGILVTFSFSATVSTSTVLWQSKYMEENPNL